MLKGCHWPALLTWIIWAAERMKYATGTCDLWWIVKRSRGRIDVVESKKQGVENKQTKKSWTSHMTGDMFKGWNWPSRLLWSIKDILKGIGLDEKNRKDVVERKKQSVGNQQTNKSWTCHMTESSQSYIRLFFEQKVWYKRKEGCKMTFK
jgi:hypothetical protein